MKKDLFYSFSCFAFTIMIGGAVYEHLNIVPQWSAAPPASLTMFQGEYGVKPEKFWMLIHPISLVLFIISLVLHWRSERKKNIVIVLSSYVAILVVTSIYFVPELISIITTPFSSVIDPELTSRAKTWELLSVIRLGILFVLAIVLFQGLSKKAGSPIVHKIKREAIPA